MAINHKELLQFIEYIEDDKLSFGININNENQIETSLVWYKVIDNLMVVYHNFNPQTQVVLRWNEVDLNYPLELFLKDMEEFCKNSKYRYNEAVQSVKSAYRYKEKRKLCGTICMNFGSEVCSKKDCPINKITEVKQ